MVPGGQCNGNPAEYDASQALLDLAMERHESTHGIDVRYLRQWPWDRTYYSMCTIVMSRTDMWPCNVVARLSVQTRRLHVTCPQLEAAARYL